MECRQTALHRHNHKRTRGPKPADGRTHMPTDTILLLRPPVCRRVCKVTVCLSVGACMCACEWGREESGVERTEQEGGLDGIAVISCDLSVIAYLFVKGVPFPPFNSLCCARGSRTSSQSTPSSPSPLGLGAPGQTTNASKLRPVAGRRELQHIWCFAVLQRHTFHSLLRHLVASSGPGVWRCSS